MRINMEKTERLLEQLDNENELKEWISRFYMKVFLRFTNNYSQKMRR